MDGEVTAFTRARASYVVDDCCGDIQAFLTLQAQAEAQIDIFKVGEVIFVKALRPHKLLAQVHGGGRTGAEDLPALQTIFLHTAVVKPPPRQPRDVIRVAGAIQQVRRMELDLARGKCADLRMLVRGAQEAFEPVGLGEGIHVEQGKPFSRCEARADIVPRGETNVCFLPFNDDVESGVVCSHILQIARVGRAVLHQHDFKVLKRLGLQGVQTGGEMLMIIPNQQEDGDNRHRHRGIVSAVGRGDSRVCFPSVYSEVSQRLREEAMGPMRRKRPSKIPSITAKILRNFWSSYKSIFTKA